MPDVSKIKLPDNSELNIKDARIPGVDSTPTSGSSNLVTSGGTHEALNDVSLVVSTALNDLNDRLSDVEDDTESLQSDSVWEVGTGTNSVIVKGSLGTAGGNYSTVEGKGCVTGGTHSTYDLTPDEADMNDGSYAHAEGGYNVAQGKASHAEGWFTFTNNASEHAEGRYNVSNKTSNTYGNAGNTQHSIGIGTASARKNAVEVMQNGDVYINDIGGYSGTTIVNAETLQDVIAEKAEFDLNNNTLYGGPNGTQFIYGYDGLVYALGSSNADSTEDAVLATTNDIPDAVTANPTVPSGTTPTTLTGLKVGSGYYSVSSGGNGGVSNLGNAKIFYGTCDTAAATTTKSVTCSSFTAADLVKGALIFVTFDYTNSAAVADLTMSVNSTDAKGIRKTYKADAPSTLTAVGELRANSTYLFCYNGTYWVCITLDYNTTYSGMTVAEYEAGTGTSARLITPARLKAAISYWMAQNQSDWEQNDSTSPDYVKNRTHYRTLVHEEELTDASFTCYSSDSEVFNTLKDAISTTVHTSALELTFTDADSYTYVLPLNQYNSGEYFAYDVEDPSYLISVYILIGYGGNTSRTIKFSLNENDFTNTGIVSSTLRLYNIKQLPVAYIPCEEIKTSTLNNDANFISNSSISTNIATDKADNTKVAGAKAVYDEIHPAVVSSQPAGGFAPNVLYDLGTITGTVTFTIASPSDATIVNHYYWTFETSSTAPTITWPVGITSWYGGSAPAIAASKHYEVSVLDGIGCIMEV